jgi:hypothetical protein
VGVQADTPTHSRLGVCIGREGEAGKTVIAPDEARTIAAELEDTDPEAAKQLRETADALPGVLAEIRAHGFSVSLVGPRITGPEALQDWVKRWRQRFRAGYQEAMASGYPADVVVWATPCTESLDDPPIGFDLRGPTEARERLARFLPNVKALVAPPGAFHVVASRAEGRFKGTYMGILSRDGDRRPTMPEDN